MKNLLQDLINAVNTKPEDMLGKKEEKEAMEEMECWQAQTHLKNCSKCWSERNAICPECEEIRKDDERVKVGMKCFNCSYGL